MEESKELNAVIDVIMLVGTLLLKSGSEIYRVEDSMIRIAHCKELLIAMFLLCQQLFSSRLKTPIFHV